MAAPGERRAGFSLLIGGGIVFVCVVFVAGILAKMFDRVTAHDLAMLAVVHVFVVPLLLAVFVLLTRVYASIEPASGELVFVHRLLGVTVARTVVPLEIIVRFVAKHTTARGSTPDTIFAETKGDAISLVGADRPVQAAEALNRALPAA